MHDQCVCGNIFDVFLILAYGWIIGVLVALHDTVHLLALVGIVAEPDVIGKNNTIRSQDGGLPHLVCVGYAQFVFRFWGPRTQGRHARIYCGK